VTGRTELPLRTVVFGDLSDGPWGAVLSGPRSLAAFAAGARRTSSVDGPTVDRSDPLEDWQLKSDGVELTVRGAGDPSRLTDPAHELDLGFDQLCQVSGRALIGGEQQTIEASGVRGTRVGIDLVGSDSVRAAWAWFDPGDAFALVAVRPRKQRGHGRDAVSASVLEPSAAEPVADPRLSTTYGADGSPLRAGLELWLEEESDHYPRRAAGETIALGEPIIDQDLEVRTVLMRWHTRGREGAGIYLVARAR
jgi:hypothetical protein